jgi:hypothetical protein
LVSLLASGDAFAQDVVKDVIRLIQMNEASFADDDFKKWAAEGKIGEDKVALFRKYAVTSESKFNWKWLTGN